MTWEELLGRLKHIPDDRMNEKAVFVVDGTEAWEIDDVSYDTVPVGVLEDNSIWQEDKDPEEMAIVLTP